MWSADDPRSACCLGCPPSLPAGESGSPDDQRASDSSAHSARARAQPLELTVGGDAHGPRFEVAACMPLRHEFGQPAVSIEEERAGGGPATISEDDTSRPSVDRLERNVVLQEG